MASKWRSIQLATDELNLSVLGFGQSFRWRKIIDAKDIVWQGIMANRVWRLKMDENRLWYRVLGRFSRCQDVNDEFVLRNYFQLDRVPNLRHLYSEWSSLDPHFATVSIRTPGIRVLRQDPLECLFGFICSTNNNIKRIGSMVETLCRLYGESMIIDRVDTVQINASVSENDRVVQEPSGRSKRRKLVDRSESTSITSAVVQESEHLVFYDFPTATKLAQDDAESVLRENGFGYRAKYLATTARMLLNEFGSETSIVQKLAELRNFDRRGATDFLLRFQGVGMKVADCICLMALDKLDAVPIDTHVRKITSEKYMPTLKKSTSLTTKIYDEIGDFYRTRFGQYAGWAHSVLFSAEISIKK